MSMRVYLVVAGAILVGAPLVVNVISGALPVAEQAAQAPAPSEIVKTAPTPAPAQQASLPDSAYSGEPTDAAPAVDAAPSLDAQGFTPATASGETPSAPPMAQQPARATEASKDEAPPPRKERFLRY